MRVYRLSAFPVRYHRIRTEFGFQSRFTEIHQEDTVYGRELVSGSVVIRFLFAEHKVVFFLGHRLIGAEFTFLFSFLADVLHLSAYGAAHVEQRTVQKVAVEAVLHLHDDVLSRSSQAVQVVDDACVRYAVGVVLLVQQGQVFYLVFPCQQFVQQRDEQFFAGRLSEDNLESDVGKRIYEVSAGQFLVPHVSSFSVWFSQRYVFRQEKQAEMLKMTKVPEPRIPECGHFVCKGLSSAVRYFSGVYVNFMRLCSPVTYFFMPSELFVSVPDRFPL